LTAIDWPGFALAVLLIELTPGPNMAWLAALSMADGRRAGLAATAGVALGLFINALAASFGLSVMIEASPLVWQLLRWGGAALMLWLGWDSWRDAAAPADRPRRSASHHFGAGLLINLLNPKALLFFLLVVPQFSGGRLPGFGEAMMLAGISITIATAVHLAIVMTGGELHRWLLDPVRTRRVRRTLALSLVGVAIWFVVAAKMPG
jgi:threonine/homoserine/homoserine lactone efflux protein